MDHPNIASVFDGGATETGRPYFVMELVQGVPITEFCDKNKLSAKERLELFIKVCRAIQHAHQKGIIHRDIKPSNVLVTLHDGVPVPKVIDFGIAKATNQRLTEKTLFTNFAQFIGTPAYMSPEQAEMTSLDVDTRTDVYSLGVLLYELLTGTTPFPEKRLRSAGYGEMQRIIAQEEPEKPSTRLSTMRNEQSTSVAKSRSMDLPSLQRLLRGDLDWITMKCLEKDRRRRYETPNELATDLKRHLGNEPVSAVAPTFSYQVRKLYARNKRLLRTLVAISFTLITATLVSGYLAFRMNELRGSEAELRTEAEAGRDRATRAENEATERSLELENHLYVSDMLAVERAVSNEEWKAAREFLNRHRTEPSGRDLRGFEWRYNWLRARGDQVRGFQAHEGSISHLEFSHDGRWLATAGADGKARLWEVATDQLIHEWDAHSNVVFSASFSHDDRYLVTAGYSGGEEVGSLKAHVWDLASKERFWSPPEEWGYALMAPAQPILATALGGGDHGFGGGPAEIQLWNYERRQPIDPPFRVRGKYMVFSPKGTFLATVGQVPPQGRSAFETWRVSTGQRIATVPLMGVSEPSFSPEETYIATTGYHGGNRAIVWEADTGREIATIKPEGRVRRAIFSPRSNEILITVSDGQTIQIWNWKEHRVVSRLTGQDSEIACLAMDSNSSLMASGDKDGAVMFWNIAEKPQTRGNQITNVLTQADPTFSQDDKFVVLNQWMGPSAMSRGILTAAQVVAPLRRNHILPSRSRKIGTSPANGDEPNPAAPPAPTIGMDPTKVWREVMYDPSSGNSLWNVPEEERTLGFSPDGSALMTVTTNQVTYRNVLTGERLRTLALDPTIANTQLHSMGGYRWVTVSPDGSRMAVVEDDHAVRLIDLATGKTMAASDGRMAVLRQPISIGHLQFSPDGNKVLYRGLFGAGCWDPQTDDRIDLTVGHAWRVNGLAASPDNKNIAGACSDNTVRIWSLKAGELVHSIQGFRETPRGVSFSKDGETLAVVRDSSPAVALWNTRTWRQIAELSHGSSAQGAHFSPYGRFLITSSLYDGALFWRAPLVGEIGDASPMSPNP